jgi:histidinol-phosphatase (PHP family)
MPFSHHSHSGQFCHHAKDALEAMVMTAIAKRMRVFALTEHMPRDKVEDLYPEEVRPLPRPSGPLPTNNNPQVEAQQTTFDLFQTFAAYYDTALLLRGKYAHAIHLLVGFEAEYIRPSSIEIVRGLQQIYKFDFFVGSVHHVNTIPIDFDRALYLKALYSVSPEGDETQLFVKYFDTQYEMLTQLKPAVVGHFDLIRLMANDPTRDVASYGHDVWSRVLRNLAFVKSYNGLLELNSSSLRKGWSTPYPGRDVCQVCVSRGRGGGGCWRLINQAFMSLSGRFTLSDDAHNCTQVGLNYGPLLNYVDSLGLTTLYYLEKLPMGEMAVDVLDACAVRAVSVAQVRAEEFWQFA